MTFIYPKNERGVEVSFIFNNMRNIKNNSTPPVILMYKGIKIWNKTS